MSRPASLLPLACLLVCTASPAQGLVASRNFVVKAPNYFAAAAVLRSAEEARTKFAEVWLDRPLADWKVPVWVDVAFGAATANGFEGQAGGYAVIEVRGPDELAVLGLVPHEVAHAVIDVEVEGRVPVPRWQHEGAAVAFEAIAYEAPGRYGKAVGRTPMLEFMYLEGLPLDLDGNAFYNQAASVALFVRDHWGCDSFWELYRKARGRGWEYAVMSVCDMTLDEFESAWLDSLSRKTGSYP